MRILIHVAALMADAHADASSQKAVLATGASTGIGRKISEAPAEKAHFVYAGGVASGDSSTTPVFVAVGR